MSGESGSYDTLRFGVVTQEGGPRDLLTYQFLTIEGLPTKICQLQEENVVNFTTPFDKDTKLHLIPDVASLKEANFRAFYGELVDDPTKKVFVTCADQHIFGRIGEEDTLFFESGSKGGLPENMYVFYRQSDINGKVLQDSIKSIDLQLASNENIGSIPQALIRPQCQNLRIAGYLGYGVVVKINCYLDCRHPGTGRGWHDA